jgi:hypothetical protein
VSELSGIAFRHGLRSEPGSLTQRAAGGVAAGDYDADGDTDLYVIAGEAGTNALFENDGAGHFQDVAARAGVDLAGMNGSGPLFFDYDGDGFVDLFVGATDGDYPILFRNTGASSFVDVTFETGLSELAGAISAAAGDYDRDGFLDLFVSHWGENARTCHLFHNDAGSRFRCADDGVGIGPIGLDGIDQTFTANFVDVNGDRRSDLLVASDFGTTVLLVQNANGQFESWESEVLSDENGMGSAIGDYDNDGHLDWFVSSIRDADGVTEGDWGTSGNRLYRNLGDGRFEDATDTAGVRDGDWGWAACFADLDQDGLLDLVHVNGWPQGSAQFRDTPARLFLNQGEGRFREAAAELGFDERSGGRGLTCFDHDGDGDLDLFVMNHGGPARLWQNDMVHGHALTVRLVGSAPNTSAIGARVRIEAGGREQVRELRAGSNYVSQDAPEAHFGLGSSDRVELVEVIWPDGSARIIRDVAADQKLVVSDERAAPEPGRVEPRSAGCSR